MSCSDPRAVIALATLLAFLFASRATLAAPDVTAWRAYERRDYATAAKLYSEDARKGERLAQFNYAMMLFRGEANETEHWYTRAAQHGDAVALVKARAGSATPD